MKTREFINELLPTRWCERDLQMLIVRKLNRVKLIDAIDEHPVHTPTSRRRIDISTALYNYEVKKFLTREAILQAAGQLAIYRHYGSKLFGIIPKRSVIIGLMPIDDDPFAEEEKIRAAQNLATDFNKMGIKVIFIDQAWGKFTAPEYDLMANSAILAASFAIALCGLIIIG